MFTDNRSRHHHASDPLYRHPLPLLPSPPSGGEDGCEGPVYSWSVIKEGLTWSFAWIDFDGQEAHTFSQMRLTCGLKGINESGCIGLSDVWFVVFTSESDGIGRKGLFHRRGLRCNWTKRPIPPPRSPVESGVTAYYSTEITTNLNLKMVLK